MSGFDDTTVGLEVTDQVMSTSFAVSWSCDPDVRIHSDVPVIIMLTCIIGVMKVGFYCFVVRPR